MDEKRYFVHESSYVGDRASIGEGTKIWHFCNIMPDATIGRDCSLGQNVFVASRVKIGSKVKIQNNVSIYEGVELEDEVFCGPSMVFTNVSTPRSGFPRNQAEDYRRTLVQRGASIGANATIVCGNTIGKFALIGAGAVVTKDVPAHAVVYGNPASVRAYACECGEILPRDSDAPACEACGRSYIRDGDSLKNMGLP